MGMAEPLQQIQLELVLCVLSMPDVSVMLFYLLLDLSLAIPTWVRCVVPKYTAIYAVYIFCTDKMNQFLRLYLECLSVVATTFCPVQI